MTEPTIVESAPTDVRVGQKLRLVRGIESSRQLPDFLERARVDELRDALSDRHASGAVLSRDSLLATQREG